VATTAPMARSGNLLGTHTPSAGLSPWGVGLVTSAMKAARLHQLISTSSDWKVTFRPSPKPGPIRSVARLGFTVAMVNEDAGNWSLSARPGFLRLLTHPEARRTTTCWPIPFRKETGG